MVVLVTPIRVQVLCMTVLTARWRPVLERAPVSALPCRIPLYTPLSCHSLFFFLLLARSPGLVFFFLFPFLLFARSRCHLKFFYRREGRKWNKTKEKRGAGGEKRGKGKKNRSSGCQLVDDVNDDVAYPVTCYFKLRK